MTLTRFLLLSVFLVAPVSSAMADSFKAPAMREGPATSIQAYGQQNKACLEWTDGCVLCVAGIPHAHCSTPGIACTPGGLTCKRHATP